MMGLAPRLILEICGGPLGSRKAVLSKGATLRVGSVDRADLVVPMDRQMSGVHFELTWDGGSCELRDLKSAKGTFLQGQRVASGEVAHGAWIRAGHTDFIVYVEGHTPPSASAPAPIEAKLLAFDALRHEKNLLAVVDASRGTRVRELLHESVDEHRSLYDGDEGDTLAHVAPYLVAFRSDSNLLERLIREGWGARWGIFLCCPRAFAEVRRHLRRFLFIEDQDLGKHFYFRFYDPHTLRAVVPSFTLRQRQEFFGEVRCFLAEGKAFDLTRFMPDGAF